MQLISRFIYLRKQLSVLNDLPPVVQDPLAADPGQEGLGDPLEVLEPRRLSLDLVIQTRVVSSNQQDANHPRVRLNKTPPLASAIAQCFDRRTFVLRCQMFSRQTVVDFTWPQEKYFKFI